MKANTPTTGRIVHVYAKSGSGPLPAIVTGMNAAVNQLYLTTFFPHAAPRTMTLALRPDTYVDNGAMTFDGDRWSWRWPPAVLAEADHRPTKAALILMVDDLIEQVEEHTRMQHGDPSYHHWQTQEAAHGVTDARTVLVTAIGMLTEGEG